MAFYKTNEMGRVTGTMMMSKDDMLPTGQHASAIDLALDAGAGFTPAKHALHHPRGFMPLHKGKPAAYSVWNESVSPPALLNPAVSDGFSATPYMQTIQMIESVFPDSTTGFAMIEHGKAIMWTIELSGEIDLGGGDVLKPNIMVVDSLDGSRATQLHSLGYRAFCENQITYGTKALSVKHSVNHSVMLSTWSAKIASAREGWAAFGDRARYLKSIDLSDRQTAISWLKRVLPEPQRTRKDTDRGFASRMTRWKNMVDAIWDRYLYESGEFGHNAWCMVQSIQGYEYHDKTKDNVAKQINVVADPEKNQWRTLRAERMFVSPL